MKRFCRIVSKSALLLLLLAFSPATGWSAGDYSLQYAALDESGGSVSGVANMAEDLMTGELQGASMLWSDTYMITSILRWPAPKSGAREWLIYQ